MRDFLTRLKDIGADWNNYSASDVLERDLETDARSVAERNEAAAARDWLYERWNRLHTVPVIPVFSVAVRDAEDICSIPILAHEMGHALYQWNNSKSKNERNSNWWNPWKSPNDYLAQPSLEFPPEWINIAATVWPNENDLPLLRRRIAEGAALAERLLIELYCDAVGVRLLGIAYFAAIYEHLKPFQFRGDTDTTPLSLSVWNTHPALPWRCKFMIERLESDGHRESLATLTKSGEHWDVVTEYILKLREHCEATNFKPSKLEAFAKELVDLKLSELLAVVDKTAPRRGDVVTPEAQETYQWLETGAATPHTMPRLATSAGLRDFFTALWTYQLYRSDPRVVASNSTRDATFRLRELNEPARRALYAL